MAEAPAASSSKENLPEEESVLREEFDEKLNSYYENQSNKIKVPWRQSRIDQVLMTITGAATARDFKKRKTNAQYYWSNIDRMATRQGIERAALAMVESSQSSQNTLEITSSVILAVPKVDRGPGDHRNLEGKIVDVKNGVYQVATTAGTIKNWFPRSELQPLIYEYQGPVSTNLISIREAVAAQSAFGGQGFQRCHCKPSRQQCCTKRCACFKNNLKCTTKCHSSLSCANK